MNLDRISAMWAYELGFNDHENPFRPGSEYWTYWWDGWRSWRFEYPRTRG